MHSLLNSFIACVALFTACGSVKADQRITCPPEIRSDQIQVRGQPGWTGFFRPGVSLKLESAGAMLGPLKDEGTLKGAVTQKGGTMEHKYSLSGGVADQLDKWMACLYQGDVYQAVKLPASTTECTVAYERNSAMNGDRQYAVGAITCK